MNRNANFLLSIVLLFILPFFGLSQDESLNTIFWHSQFLRNPAFTGISGRHEINSIYQNQWNYVSPSWLTLGYATPVREMHGGIGISYLHDGFGFNKKNQVLMNYAFHKKVKNKSIVSLGVSTGWIQISSSSSLPQYSDEHNFRLNFGVAVVTEKWRLGFGSTQLNTLGKNSSLYINNLDFLFGEYRIALFEHNWLIPRIQFSTDYLKIQEEISIGFYSEKLWAGINYQNLFKGSYIGCMFGYDFAKKYRLGYCFNFPVNKHELDFAGLNQFLFSYSLDGFQQRSVILESDSLE